MKFKFLLAAALFAVAFATTSCKEEPTETPKPPVEVGEFVAQNKWMFGYMKSHYLWNEEVKNLEDPAIFDLDYNLNYDEFLPSILLGVTEQNNANADDGYYDGDKRHYYSLSGRYKYSASSANTRFGETNLYGFGFNGIQSVTLNGKFYFAVLGVVADSPADKAGITRGIYISAINGTELTRNNAQTLYNMLFPSSATTIRFSLNTVLPSDPEKYDYQVKSIGGVEAKSASYVNNPVLYTDIISKASNANEKVGYIAYKEFNMTYDNKLIEAFTDFKSNRITDLIIDLRNNGGGHLMSSLVMGTLVAGNEYKDQVYSYTSYNKDRNQKDTFYIGNKNTVEGVHQLVEDALAAAVNLKCIYILCNKYTASASELVVNGLRGLDIEVRLVGEKTNGKNVGMEGIGKRFGAYVYEIAPITLRLENKKGFSDYGDGFTPEVNIETPDRYVTGGYASLVDPLFRMAMKWINTGSKPTFVVPAPTRGGMQMEFDEPMYPATKLHGTIIFPAQKQE